MSKEEILELSLFLGGERSSIRSLPPGRIPLRWRPRQRQLGLDFRRVQCPFHAPIYGQGVCGRHYCLRRLKGSSEQREQEVSVYASQPARRVSLLWHYQDAELETTARLLIADKESFNIFNTCIALDTSSKLFASPTAAKNHIACLYGAVQQLKNSEVD